MVIAHRGGAALAPENTIAAFRRAIEVGADGVELDVRLTKDQRVVVLHDRRLERTTSGRGLIGTHTLEQLSQLDAGSWFSGEFNGERVPALDEVFESLPADLPVYVELKVRGTGAWRLASAVVGVIRRFQRWESTMVASFNPISVAFVRLKEPRIIRGYISSAYHPLPIRERWLSPLVNPDWYAPDRDTLTPRLLARFHSQGKQVAGWGMDVGMDPEKLRAFGLDAVVTDHPDKLINGNRPPTS